MKIMQEKSLEQIAAVISKIVIDSFRLRGESKFTVRKPTIEKDYQHKFTELMSLVAEEVIRKGYKCNYSFYPNAIACIFYTSK